MLRRCTQQMKLLKTIIVLVLIALTYFIGDAFFYRNSLTYENGRHFNEATGTVYKEQAVTVFYSFLSQPSS